MVAKECNSGLRLINANYTADGSGRDRMTFFDAGYRGGQVLMNTIPSHMNHASSAPYPPKIPADKLWNKLEMRPYDNTQRYASLTKNVASFKESIKTRSMPTLPSADHLFEQPQPEMAFTRSKGMSSTGTLRIPPPPKPGTPPPPPRFNLPEGDMKRHQYMGIARTPYGGFWRTMSMIGPG
jgi:hypothetical protein